MFPSPRNPVYFIKKGWDSATADDFIVDNDELELDDADNNENSSGESDSESLISVDTVGAADSADLPEFNGFNEDIEEDYEEVLEEVLAYTPDIFYAIVFKQEKKPDGSTNTSIDELEISASETKFYPIYFEYISRWQNLRKLTIHGYNSSDEPRMWLLDRIDRYIKPVWLNTFSTSFI